MGRGGKKRKPPDGSDMRGSQASDAGVRNLPHQDSLSAHLQDSTLHTQEAGSYDQTFTCWDDYCSHQIENRTCEINNQTCGLLKI